MTDARLGGLGREALVSSTGELRAGGLVREALVSGIALSGSITARAFGSAAATAAFTGLALGGAGFARSGAQAVLTFTVTGTIRASSSAKAEFPVTAETVTRRQYAVTVF